MEGLGVSFISSAAYHHALADSQGQIVIEFLDWLARAGGVVAILTAVLGYVFREKWKQVLQRSLSEDLERLKSELAKSQAEHAATLTPQLEQIKHDFQQKMEAYKVTLIAETEAVKAKGELKKTIALRYAEVEFERLVTLEHVLAPIASELIALGSIGPEQKTLEHAKDALARLGDLSAATDKAEMFMPMADRMELIHFRKKLLDLVRENVGPGKPISDAASPKRAELLQLAARTHTRLMDKIRLIGAL